MKTKPKLIKELRFGKSKEFIYSMCFDL